ncbi:MAG: DNA-3-methyladenine glycosylase I [Armatimonadetes bacterium]|nr:DNA-3-methyladenine glycosylase I [Armatimonadota bacterium]
MERCGWCRADPLYVEYHDREWGVPVRDDRRLFEFVVLEGAQAGLSWLTILRRREAYREAFCEFDPERVAALGPGDVESLLANPGIIRNRRKVESVVTNARAFLEIQAEFGSFARYMWDFVEGCPIQNRWDSLAQIPAETELSRRISKELRVRGFKFMGPTIVYAHMQATGMVNDHLVSCYRYRELQAGAKPPAGLTPETRTP